MKGGSSPASIDAELTIDRFLAIPLARQSVFRPWPLMARPLFLSIGMRRPRTNFVERRAISVVSVLRFGSRDPVMQEPPGP